MADDPNKRGSDKRTVSWQDHEIRYVTEKVTEEFPRVDKGRIEQTISFCKNAIQPSEGRAKLMECVWRQLRK